MSILTPEATHQLALDLFPRVMEMVKKELDGINPQKSTVCIKDVTGPRCGYRTVKLILSTMKVPTDPSSERDIRFDYQTFEDARRKYFETNKRRVGR